MYDVAIIGGGVAGLSAALLLGRANRSVLVVDGGLPRNAPAEHSHGFLTRDGTPPLELLELSRSELEAYPNVELRQGGVDSVAGSSGRFNLTLADGTPIEARKLVLATGVTDALPAVEGLAELWGRGVYHCPFCHGWEVRNRRWAVLGDTPLAVERATLFSGWTSDLVVLANGVSQLGTEASQRIVELGAVHDERRITRVELAGGSDVSIRFEDGTSIVVGAIFVAPQQGQRSDIAESLGCEIEDIAPTASRYVKVDPQTGETSVRGVYAAGDMTGPAQSLVLASASGARPAYALAHVLAKEDVEARSLTPA